MMRLVSDKGRWAKLDNSMIFSNVIYLTERNDALSYHLIDDNGKEIRLNSTVFDYIVDENEDNKRNKQ